jgi:NADH:ubiquinone reductase (H+-translocating)
MAVVGKGFAIVQSGRMQMSGFPAWLAWACIHIRFLALQNLRASVLLQWMWTCVTGGRGSRLIVNNHAPAAKCMQPISQQLEEVAAQSTTATR